MKRIFLLSALVLCVANLGAQAAGRGAPPRNEPAIPRLTPSQSGARGMGGTAGGQVQPIATPYTRALISPELVMMRQQEIGLRDDQRSQLSREMASAQSKFTEAQWTLSAEQGKLELLLQGPTVDEAAVLAQMDRVLTVEQGLKRTQMVMLVRVKNVLTPEQQASLMMMGAGGGPGGMRGGGGRGGRGGMVP